MKVSPPNLRRTVPSGSARQFGLFSTTGCGGPSLDCERCLWFRRAAPATQLRGGAAEPPRPTVGRGFVPIEEGPQRVSGR